MPLSPQSHSSTDSSLDILEVKKRVIKACQRCRLKKCKCDGATPCTRCKSDDAICAYGKHKKSDKTVFRSGYVQMLERSHAQLTAGLQELFRRTQNSDGWTGPRLELENHKRPLTHQILEALGVLRTEDWEEPESVDDNGQGFEGYVLDKNGWMFSESASPPTQVTFSPGSPTQTNFPHSEIMSKRRSKLHSNLPLTAQTLTMPPPVMTTSDSIKAEPYSQAFPSLTPAFLDTFTSKDGMGVGLDGAAGSTMDWTFGMDDMFGHLGSQEHPIHPIQGR